LYAELGKYVAERPFIANAFLVKNINILILGLIVEKYCSFHFRLSFVTEHLVK